MFSRRDAIIGFHSHSHANFRLSYTITLYKQLLINSTLELPGLELPETPGKYFALRRLYLNEGSHFQQ